MDRARDIYEMCKSHNKDFCNTSTFAVYNYSSLAHPYSKNDTVLWTKTFVMYIAELCKLLHYHHNGFGLCYEPHDKEVL